MENGYIWLCAPNHFHLVLFAIDNKNTLQSEKRTLTSCNSVQNFSQIYN